jgi:hypothetical protein
VNTVFIGSAYPTAVVSPKNIALNGFGAPASLFNPSLISVGSFYITAAWNDGLHVDMQGLRNGTIVYQASVVASTASPMLVHLNWHGADEVDFQSYGGIPIGSGPGTHFVLDDLTVSAATGARFHRLHDERSFQSEDHARHRMASHLVDL